MAIKFEIRAYSHDKTIQFQVRSSSRDIAMHFK